MSRMTVKMKQRGSTVFYRAEHSRNRCSNDAAGNKRMSKLKERPSGIRQYLTGILVLKMKIQKRSADIL